MMYEIFEGNMERLEKKLNRIANKCKKYGCDFKYEQVGESFREIKDDNGNIITARFVQIDVEGKALINDWEFIATVEHTEKGNIINRANNAVEVPERYYDSKPVCEHCNSSRARKNTYIVRNVNSGEFKQVGKSCLNDFTNGMSAEGIAHYMSLFEEVIAGEAPYPGSHFESYIDKMEGMQFIAETIRKFGYVRTHDSGLSTAARALNYLDAYYKDAGRHMQAILEKEMEDVSFDHNAPEVIAEAKTVLDWIADQDEENNYFHNLKVVCASEYIKRRNFGLLASVFPAHNRELDRMAEKAERERKAAAERANEANSVHVGNVKDRITVDVHSYKCVTSFDSDFGTVRIYKFVDVNGNVFTWKTGNIVDGDVKTITGTIKGHNEYRGIKQTELTRCRIAA